jgi:hypothetical protein
MRPESPRFLNFCVLFVDICTTSWVREEPGHLSRYTYRIQAHRLRNHSPIAGRTGEFFFTALSSVAQDPTQAHIQWIPVTFHRVVMRPRSEADRSSRSGTEIKNEWSYASVPHMPSWRHRDDCIKQGNKNV